MSRQIRLKSLSLTQGLKPKDHKAELIACNAFVRDQIRYSRDVYFVETLQTPIATLTFGQGDCDDKATLLASLLSAIGFQVRFAYLKRGANVIHVWTQANLKGKNGPMWINCETTENVPCGQMAGFAPGDQVLTYPVKPYEP